MLGDLLGGRIPLDTLSSHGSALKTVGIPSSANKYDDGMECTNQLTTESSIQTDREATAVTVEGSREGYRTL
jgi:hypothetical protein